MAVLPGVGGAEAERGGIGVYGCVVPDSGQAEGEGWAAGH